MGQKTAFDAIDDLSSTMDVRGEAEVILVELRVSLAAVLQGLGPAVGRSSQLQQHLGLDKKLSWSIFSAATATDPYTLASLLPGRRAMERFFTAALERGVGAALIERSSTAFEKFEVLVAQRAGSRDAFETIVSELRDEAGTAGAAELKHKRAAFRAMSMLWGRQVRIVYGARIMHPSTAAGLLDTVFVKGMVGVRRTRRSVPLHITAYRARTRLPEDPPMPAPQPLDPRETEPDAIGLLRDFCSQPLPRFRLRESAQGYRSHELINGGLGVVGEVTYFTGEVCRGDTSAPGDSPDWSVSVAKTVDIPTEVFFADLVMHRSLCERRPPEVRVFAMPLDGSLELREMDLLPLVASAEYIGEGVESAISPLVPRHGDMLAYAMNAMNWNGDDFRVFRCRVEYPVMHTRIVMTLRGD